MDKAKGGNILKKGDEKPRKKGGVPLPISWEKVLVQVKKVLYKRKKKKRGFSKREKARAKIQKKETKQ
ncbi:MAG: hypothetical protein CM15mV137_150 [uncultured marine virus]|nr:MAG: hypothetical protein CM15mV137_150 [uncultured marine virus]